MSRTGVALPQNYGGEREHNSITPVKDTDRHTDLACLQNPLTSINSADTVTQIPSASQGCAAATRTSKSFNTQTLKLFNAISVSLPKSWEQTLGCLWNMQPLWLDVLYQQDLRQGEDPGALVLWIIEPRWGTIGFHRIQESLYPAVRYPACLAAPTNMSQVGSAF